MILLTHNHRYILALDYVVRCVAVRAANSLIRRMQQ
jgi:hypothetical protein